MLDFKRSDKWYREIGELEKYCIVAAISPNSKRTSKKTAVTNTHAEGLASSAVGEVHVDRSVSAKGRNM